MSQTNKFPPFKKLFLRPYDNLCEDKFQYQSAQRYMRCHSWFVYINRIFAVVIVLMIIIVLVFTFVDVDVNISKKYLWAAPAMTTIIWAIFVGGMFKYSKNAI